MTSYVRMVAVLAFAMTGLLVAPDDARAQAGRAQVREGNRLYEEGRYREAHETYLEGLAAAPESGVIPFNDGNALYRSDEYERAAEAYQRAIENGEDPALASSAWYNLGNALYRRQQLQESLEAFKQTLRLDPSDSDAKHNLERVLDELQQQDQQQEEQQEEQPQGGDQDQDEEQDRQQDQQDEPQTQQDQRQDEQQPDGQEPSQDPQGPGGQARPEPGAMTPEEAQRLLDAIDENPEDVDRRRAAAAGRRPQRPW